MAPESIKVSYLDGYRLKLVFENGKRGIADFSALVDEAKGLMIPLRRIPFFKRVRVNRELGTIVWPNGVDICPDVLYWMATGTPITWATEAKYHRPPPHFQKKASRPTRRPAPAAKR